MVVVVVLLIHVTCGGGMLTVKRRLLPGDDADEAEAGRAGNGKKRPTGGERERVRLSTVEREKV